MDTNQPNTVPQNASPVQGVGETVAASPAPVAPPQPSTEEPQRFLPFPNVNLSTIFSRSMMGLGAGFCGSVVLGIILFFTWSVVGDSFNPAPPPAPDVGLAIEKPPVEGPHPLFVSVIVLAVFLSSLVANIAHVLLSTTLQDKTDIRSTVLTHVFFGNLIILLLMIPVYISSSSVFGPNGVSVLGLFHVFLSVLFSVTIYDILGQSKYLGVNLYGTLLGFSIFFLLASALGENISVVAFLALPFILGSMELGDGLAERCYNFVYLSYGTDFLNVDTRFGSDYGEEDQPVAQVSNEEFDL